MEGACWGTPPQWPSGQPQWQVVPPQGATPQVAHTLVTGAGVVAHLGGRRGRGRVSQGGGRGDVHVGLLLHLQSA